ncbi:large ribosomal subunit protein bL20m-like [Sycon ciliatum]|uniref:large ribosomal subunit protein bL20m-like n=1 Tax=Sycon ciliatum TaxID=27933 RepID=UPI0020A9A0AE|eukprot:scpid66530/ scgid23797/ 39S ribosomal protein L20, mitochondrial
MPIGVAGKRIGPQIQFPKSLGHQRKTRKIRYKYYAIALRGKVRTAYRIGQIAVRRQMVKATYARKVKNRDMRLLAINRITASLRDHSVGYPPFMDSLSRHNIVLNRFMLAELAISEPRTFRALSELSLERSTAGLNDAAFFDGHKQSRIIVQGERPVRPRLNRNKVWVEAKKYEGNPFYDDRNRNRKKPVAHRTSRVGNFNYAPLTSEV